MVFGPPLYPLSKKKNLGSTPTIVPILHLSSPQPAQPKECNAFTTHSPLGCTICLSKIPVNLVGEEISHMGSPVTLGFLRSAHGSLHKALEPFSQQENALQDYNLFYRNTHFFLKNKTQLNNGFLQAQNGQCSFHYSSPLLISKIYM
jgi:hypothetical protein